MGEMTIKCNSRQLKSILKDFEDASVDVETAYGRLHKGETELKMFYNDQEDSIVAGIVKYRMRINEER